MTPSGSMGTCKRGYPKAGLSLRRSNLVPPRMAVCGAGAPAMAARWTPTSTRSTSRVARAPLRRGRDPGRSSRRRPSKPHVSATALVPAEQQQLCAARRLRHQRQAVQWRLRGRQKRLSEGRILLGRRVCRQARASRRLRQRHAVREQLLCRRSVLRQALRRPMRCLRRSGLGGPVHAGRGRGAWRPCRVRRCRRVRRGLRR